MKKEKSINELNAEILILKKIKVPYIESKIDLCLKHLDSLLINSLDYNIAIKKLKNNQSKYIKTQRKIRTIQDQINFLLHQINENQLTDFKNGKFIQGNFNFPSQKNIIQK